MNVARLNFSHGDHEMHARSLSNLRKAVEARPGCHCAVLLDTKGPEIRTGLLKNHEPIQLKVCPMCLSLGRLVLKSCVPHRLVSCLKLPQMKRWKVILNELRARTNIYQPQ